MHVAVKYLAAVGSCAALAVTLAIAADFPGKSPGADKYSQKVEGGLAFADFKGYETWEPISLSHNGNHLALISGNKVMIDAMKSGIPDNGKPFPDGARMSKVHWEAKKQEGYPGQPLVAGPLHDVDFMVKDSKRYADSNGWGYGAFSFDQATGKYRPADTTAQPPQGHDAKCGAACHVIAKNRDYVFTFYAPR